MATMVVAVSGSASGIGAALRRRLEDDRHRVIGVDLRDAEVTADLAVPAGRATAIAGVRAQAGGTLDGVVACAGVGPHTRDWPAIVSIDYFGATALLTGLREALLPPAGAAVAVSSNSSTISPVDGAIVRACLAGDEAAARARAAETDGQLAYASAKRALALFVRRAAPAWAAEGRRLNAVAPGAVDTPLLAGGLADPVYGPAIRAFPIPLGLGRPEQVAGAVAFLLGPESAFCCGCVLFVDGGSDALLRPDGY